MKPANRTVEIIDISDENIRQYWAQRLGVSTEALKSAIRASRNLEFETIFNYLTNKQNLQAAQ